MMCLSFKVWKERWNMRKRRKRILKDIKEAKKVYLDYKENYMCLCFRRVDKDRYRYLEDIQKYIPEFNRTDMNAEIWAFYNSQWWDIWDRESRIKAFDKLIELYSK
jgi:hypothetical protein